MEVKRRPETSEAGQACGLGRWRALVSMLCDHDTLVYCPMD